MYKKRSGPREKNAETAVKTAVAILAYKENTEAELFGKLIARGFDRGDAAEAVRYTVEKGFLSEKRYFLRFVEYCAATKHFGRRRILQEAHVKKFSEETLAAFSEDAFGALDFDGLCYEALLRCGLPAEKAVPHLLRRGYSSENLHAAFAKYQFEHGVSYKDRNAADTSDDPDDPDGAL